MPGRTKAGSAASRRGHASTAATAAPLALPKRIEAAAENGKVDVVQTWLAGAGRADATCVHRGVSGCTLLLIAAEHGHKEIVELLLKRGAEADARDGEDCTALMAAAAHGHEQVAEMLLRHGAGIHLQDSAGITALMMAAANGHEQVAEMLLRHGAEINFQNSWRHRAAGRRFPQPSRRGAPLVAGGR